MVCFCNSVPVFRLCKESRLHDLLPFWLLVSIRSNNKDIVSEESIVSYAPRRCLENSFQRGLFFNDLRCPIPRAVLKSVLRSCCEVCLDSCFLLYRGEMFTVGVIAQSVQCGQYLETESSLKPSIVVIVSKQSSYSKRPVPPEQSCSCNEKRDDRDAQPAFASLAA